MADPEEEGELVVLGPALWKGKLRKIENNGTVPF
jgi:hypothetical protein